MKRLILSILSLVLVLTVVAFFSACPKVEEEAGTGIERPSGEEIQPGTPATEAPPVEAVTPEEGAQEGADEAEGGGEGAEEGTGDDAGGGADEGTGDDADEGAEEGGDAEDSADEGSKEEGGAGETTT